MSDELEAKTDAELNEAFAMEVAGWTWTKFADALPNVKRWKDAEGRRFIFDEVGAFCTDANAVLPWLEKQNRWDVNFVGDAKWKERAYCADVGGFKVMALSFGRAAVIALLRANRASKRATP